MRKTTQEAPFAVQIELVEGCNLRCAFCGLSGIRKPKENDYRYMSEETLESTISQMVLSGWNPRVEFAMHGEPTMHPNYVNMVKIVRYLAPRYHIMMTSNGGGILRKPGPVANVIALFAAGLNVLALDDYQGVGIVPKIRHALHSAAAHHGVPRQNEYGKFELTHDGVQFHGYEYPDDSDGNPHQRTGRNEHKLSFIKDISVAKEGTHSLLNNHAGAGAPLNDRGQGKRCAKPFRELSIRWDGSVAICCNDWRGTFKCGNVVWDGLDAVWNGEAMHAARQKLILGQRDFGPCKGCDATSYRVGLLPDKKGQVKMQKPNSVTAQAIRTALAGPPLTAPVLREWEKQH